MAPVCSSESWLGHTDGEVLARHGGCWEGVSPFPNAPVHPGVGTVVQVCPATVPSWLSSMAPCTTALGPPHPSVVLYGHQVLKDVLCPREVTADVAETPRELESEMGPEDGTGLFWFHDKTSADQELLLRGERRKWFLEKDSTAGGDAVKPVEMTTKDWNIR